MVQRTYGAMTNDVLISIPLFVLMGYVMERGALVDKMFYSIQLAFRRVPASLAVATLIVCTFWGIASGLVGAVVVLMGVIAFNPMLRAGYDVKLAAGVITAGGTLGILIPPSVMIIVYAAVAGQSVVKLYAAAMFPGLLPGVPLSRLRRRLGADSVRRSRRRCRKSRPAFRCRTGCASSRRPIRTTCSSACCRALFSPARARTIDVDGKPHRATGLLRQELRRRAGAVHADRRHALAGVVVRRHPSAGRRRGGASKACSSSAAPAAARRRRRPTAGRRTPSTSGSSASPRSAARHDRALLLRIDRRAASRSSSC